MLGDRGPETIGIPHGGHHLVSAVIEQARESVPQECLVLGNRYSHGSSAVSVVP